MRQPSIISCALFALFSLPQSRKIDLRALLSMTLLLGGCVVPDPSQDIAGQSLSTLGSWLGEPAILATAQKSQGTRDYPDGVRYEGEFKDGQRHGKGIQTWPDGARYEGTFSNDKRHGRGLFTWPTQARYEGEFVDGKRHGQGVYSWPNGARYEGTYLDGQRHGTGILSHPPDAQGMIKRERQVWNMDQRTFTSPMESIRKEDRAEIGQAVATSIPTPTLSPSFSTSPVPNPELDRKETLRSNQTTGSATVPRGQEGSSVGKGSGTEKLPQWTDPETGITLVQVPRGCFLMGSDTWDENEKPPHEVCLDSFWIGAHEITQKQWRLVMNWMPEQSIQDDRLPVGNVSWQDVEQFFQELNKRSGVSMRLPTEAQWEFACTGGGVDQRHCGSGAITDLAWVEENSDNRPHAPGERAPNRFGLHDMSGNLWEWVADWYDADAYRYASRDNPDGPVMGKTRVYRGGGWLSRGDSVRATLRYDMDPKRSYHLLGFRPAATRVLEVH
ncbi:MAG: SUMF1/EgtB/PvdO family nonheme iron enzyme [Magnetococcales bacterium]|nr:SUMF1/EgtB/PvdO family nonheme iron enzyme [Magnetococcales bacterium]